MKQLTEFPPILQRLVSDMSEEQLQQSLISEGVFRHCPAVTTTQIGINLAVSIAVDLRSFREEQVLLLRIKRDDEIWTTLVRHDDRRVVAALEADPPVFSSHLVALGFWLRWSNPLEIKKDVHRLTGFERFLVVAAKKGYCSKVGCTTCGASTFRDGLILLSLGAEPGSIRWERLESSLKAGLVVDRRSIYSSESFCRQLARLNAEEVDRACPDSNWRRYLPLVLSEMESLETKWVNRVRIEWERLDVPDNQFTEHQASVREEVGKDLGDLFGR